MDTFPIDTDEGAGENPALVIESGESAHAETPQSTLHIIGRSVVADADRGDAFGIVGEEEKARGPFKYDSTFSADC